MSGGLMQSVQHFIAGLLDLGRTRFELFGTELREELARLTAAVLGGLAVLVLAALGLGFSGFALVLYVGEENRLAAVIGVAVFFFLAAVVVGFMLRRMAEAKPRAFDATISELQRDLTVIRQ
jgi:uncharacterized membrane protein YqjE